MFKFSKPYHNSALLCGYCNEKNSPNTLNDLLLTSSNSRGVGWGVGGERLKLLPPLHVPLLFQIFEQTKTPRPQKNKPFLEQHFSASLLPIIKTNLTLFGLYFSHETMTTKKKKQR